MQEKAIKKREVLMKAKRMADALRHQDAVRNMRLARKAKHDREHAAQIKKIAAAKKAFAKKAASAPKPKNSSFFIRHLVAALTATATANSWLPTAALPLDLSTLVASLATLPPSPRNA